MESGSIAFLVAVFATPVLIRFLRARALGQRIREDGPSTHLAKEGTPTMGGVVIVIAAVVGYIMGHVGTATQFTRPGLLVVAVTVASGLLGFFDDYLGIRNARNLGLNKRGKFLGQLAIGTTFALLAVYWVHTSTNLSFSRESLPGWSLGVVGWSLMALFVVVGTSNAVNLTDGLDGLAAGSSTFCFAVLSVMAYWAFRHIHIYHLPSWNALDLGLFCVGLVGACSRLSVVECGTGAHHHGRHRLARHWDSPRGELSVVESRPVARRHRWPLRRGDVVGHLAGD
jgi:phospho-N-acetylmuramoyl-pentapeptide-transferase